MVLMPRAAFVRQFRPQTWAGAAQASTMLCQTHALESWPPPPPQTHRRGYQQSAGACPKKCARRAHCRSLTSNSRPATASRTSGSRAGGMLHSSNVRWPEYGTGSLPTARCRYMASYGLDAASMTLRCPAIVLSVSSARCGSGVT